MAKIRFRLEVKLRLAKYALENIQAILAQELNTLAILMEERKQQSIQLSYAIDGQRQASLTAPHYLAVWLAYVLSEQAKLRKCEEILLIQSKTVDEARAKAVEIYRELKKFERLKEKEAMAFMDKQLRQEQTVTDETGQILFHRIRGEKHE